jgi:hypothetical protein
VADEMWMPPELPEQLEMTRPPTMNPTNMTTPRLTASLSQSITLMTRDVYHPRSGTAFRWCLPHVPSRQSENIDVDPGRLAGAVLQGRHRRINAKLVPQGRLRPESRSCVPRLHRKQQ